MFTQSILAARQKPLLPIEATQTRKPPIFVSVTLLLLFGMVVLIFGVVITVHTLPIPQLLDLDLPQIYRPGSPLPDDVLCYFAPSGTLEGCHILYRGNKVHLKLDTNMKVIAAANIATQNYTIGDLLATWGTPTGIVQTHYMTFVDWGTRKAYVYADSFRPDSPVRLVQYNPNPQRTTPWRGFVQFRN